MRSQRQGGNSLIEILITIAVIGIGLLAVYSLFTVSIRSAARSRHMGIAYQRLGQSMEEIRSQSFSSLTIGTVQENIANLPSGQLVKTIENFQSDNRLKKITVEIRWSERNKPQSVKETTLVTSGGIGG